MTPFLGSLICRLAENFPINLVGLFSRAYFEASRGINWIILNFEILLKNTFLNRPRN